jgi:hypothetical protein
MRRIVISSLIGLCWLSTVSATAQAPAAGKSSPVERPIAGDMGMSFGFGGLAPMNVNGIVGIPVNRAFVTEVGLRYMVADKWVLPFSVGMGLLNFSPDGGGDAQTDLGLSFTVGVQRYFRTWRRIAPFWGVKLHLHYADPTGPSNYVVQLAVGPSLGIEYFIADRVSLSMEYLLFLGFQFAGGAGGTQVGFGTQLWMGGQMTLTFYF